MSKNRLLCAVAIAVFLPSIAAARNPVRVVSSQRVQCVNGVCLPGFGSQSFQYPVKTVSKLTPAYSQVVQSPVVVKSHAPQVYVAPQSHKQQSALDVLQQMQKVHEEYETIRKGMEAMGYVSRAEASAQVPVQPQYAPQYVPYAQAPYVQGSTSYHVEKTKVESFGPQSVAEIMAMTARYADRANDGANQLMTRAQATAEKIATSIDTQSAAAIEVARIEAESRGQAAIAEAMLKAIEAGKPTPKTTYESQRYVPQPEAIEVPEYRSSVEATAAASVGFIDTPLITQTCSKCHGGDAEKEPSAGLRLIAGMSLTPSQVVAAISSVVQDQMPPSAKDEPLDTATKARLIAELQSLSE